MQDALDILAALTPNRSTTIELARVTEAAAIAAYDHIGRGDKNAADGAAVDAMRSVLTTVDLDGVVIIGEGEKDEAPMLYNGEHVGTGRGALVDIAVDPIDGTTLTSKGRQGALSVIALSERGSMFDPGPCVYMEKLAVGPEGKGAVSLDLSLTENLLALSHRLNRPVSQLRVAILDRDRHADLIAEAHDAGARVHAISDGDVAAAIATAWGTAEADLLVGIGGSPEGIIAAAALKGLGGQIQCRLWPRNDAERHAALAAGYDLDRILYTDDLVAGDHAFFAATGITDGELLRGVKLSATTATTHSLVVRSSSRTVRLVEAIHQLDRTR